MKTALKSSPEYREFKKLELWKAIPSLPLLESALHHYRESSLLFDHLYDQTKNVYSKLPKRMNGDEAFVHPLNIVVYLQQAGIKDEVTLCAGLIHDLPEEKVDVFKEENKIKGFTTGLNQLDQYEQQVFTQFRRELLSFSRKKMINPEIIKQLLLVTKLLTRNKKDFYYKYIHKIFRCSDVLAKERALEVKLADRIHNSICIECFSEEKRNYQCFKNLFILNNTKKYLLEKFLA